MASRIFKAARSLSNLFSLRCSWTALIIWLLLTPNILGEDFMLRLFSTAKPAVRPSRPLVLNLTVMACLLPPLPAWMFFILISLLLRTVIVSSSLSRSRFRLVNLFFWLPALPRTCWRFKLLCILFILSSARSRLNFRGRLLAPLPMFVLTTLV